MKKTLPNFMYSSEEYVKTVFTESDLTCDCCNRERGYHYSGPLYMAGESEVVVCPWCIYDGSAAKKYEAQLNEIDDQNINQSVVTEICERTPGINAWQEQTWPTHCNDACVYHGDATSQDVAEASELTRQKWMSDYEQDVESWSHFMKDYHPDGDQGVYKFLCRHCGLVIFNWDFS